MKSTDSIIQLTDYFLDEVSFELKGKRFAEDNFDITPHFALDDGKRSARVKLVFEIEQEIFYMKGALIGTFTYEEGHGDEEIRELIVVNGVTILFPYLRSTISAISHAANVPTIIIPTMNILDYLHKKFE